MYIWPLFLLRSNIHFWNQYEKTVFQIRYSWRKNVSSLRRDTINAFWELEGQKWKKPLKICESGFLKAAFDFDVLTTFCARHRNFETLSKSLVPVHGSSDCYCNANFFVNNKCIFFIKEKRRVYLKMHFFSICTPGWTELKGQNMEH